jgi:hypothetical protein
MVAVLIASAAGLDWRFDWHSRDGRQTGHLIVQRIFRRSHPVHFGRRHTGRLRSDVDWSVQSNIWLLYQFKRNPERRCTLRYTLYIDFVLTLLLFIFL